MSWQRLLAQNSRESLNKTYKIGQSKNLIGLVGRPLILVFRFLRHFRLIDTKALFLV